MPDIHHIIENIKAHNKQTPSHYQLTPIGGGSINDAYRLQLADKLYFIKLNQPQLAFMFDAEARGLADISALHCIRTPQVICHGHTDDYSYIVLEYITLNSLHGASSRLLGKQLADMHKKQQDFYGWHINNTIGSTMQYNDRQDDWPTFWQNERLKKQLNLASQNGYNGSLQDKGRQLIDQVPTFFTRYLPHPALLHGDLWGGNAASDTKGNPVIFDPACYYGDRETDIAMTELFGGFGSDFLAAYQDHYPLDVDYKVRKTLYNLYHILNHLNLFGGGYLNQAEAMIEKLLSA